MKKMIQTDQKVGCLSDHFLTRIVGSNTMEEAVYRADGMRLYGIDAELEKKVYLKILGNFLEINFLRHNQREI